MCHIGNAPGNLSELLDLLRPGDVLTHAYSGAGNNTVVNGKVLAAALAAKKRGVLIDVGHGGGSFDYTVCEAALQQGFTPDIISSDIHAVSVNTPGKPFLPWVMSKFLNLGMPLEQVVTLATAAPAKAIGRVPKLGTLQIGAPADLSMVEIVEGPVDFVDTRQNTAQGPALDQADADGEGGAAVRPALSAAFRLAVTRSSSRSDGGATLYLQARRPMRRSGTNDPSSSRARPSAQEELRRRGDNRHHRASDQCMEAERLQQHLAHHCVRQMLLASCRTPSR